MKGLKKFSTRIFLRIFIGTLSVISIAAVADYIYSRELVVGLVTSNVDRALKGAYSEVTIDVVNLVSRAETAANVLAKNNLSKKNKIILQEQLFNKCSGVIGVGIAQQDGTNKDFVSYKKNDTVIISKLFYTPVKSIFDSISAKYGEESASEIQLRYDTVSYYYWCRDDGRNVFVWFDIMLQNYLDILEQNSSDLPSRHYLFDSNYEVLLNTTRRLSSIEIDEQMHEADVVKSYLEKNKLGLIVEPVLGNNHVIYIGVISGADYYLASIINIDEIIRKFKRFTIISYLIKIFAIVLLAYILQRIIRQLTKPIAELTEISKKIEQGSLHINIPEYVTDGETAQLSNTLRTVQSRMKRYVSSLNSTLKTKRAIEHELKMANKIQFDMIPAARLALNDIPEVNVYAEMIPAKGVAGDFYDYFLVDPHNLFFVLGDVSGKGMPAALFMVKALTLMKSSVKKSVDLPSIMKDVNEQLCQNNEEGMFVTAISGNINLPTGKVVLCDAGHNTPLFMKNNASVSYFELNKGMPLGVMPNANYMTTEFTLKLKDTIFLYSDGFPECTNDKGGMLGEDEFKDLIEQNRSKQLSDLASAVWYQIELFRNGANPNDDTTMLFLSYCGDGENKN